MYSDSLQTCGTVVARVGLVVVFVVCLPFLAPAQEKVELACLLTNAAVLHDTAYLGVRQRILDLGTNALPSLAMAATDTNTDWRTHLVARICYERIVRSNDITVLRNQDWKSFPPYQPGSKEMQSILGPGAFMGSFAADKCVEAGLWYYYLEVIWKGTKEVPETSMGVKFNAKWPWWCVQALIHAPEKWYRPRVLADYFERTSPGDPSSIDIYKALFAQHDPECVPLLIRRYDEFKDAVPGPDVSADSWVPKQFPGKIDTILSFSDARHVAQLDKFLGEHSALVAMTNRLSGVRARPGPRPTSDPPFRLGTNLVVATP